MSKKKAEAPTPQTKINEVLGTSDKTEQLTRIVTLMTAKPVTLVVTANPVSGDFSLSSAGAPSFKLLYEMLDFARDGVMEREKRALLETVSQNNEATLQE